MSSPEDIFGSSDFADEFAGIEAAVFREFWQEEAAVRTELFAKVRDQLSDIRANYTVGNKGNWQSFHRLPDPEGTTNIWVVHELGIGLTDDTTHIISCWEGYNVLRYAEYVLSGKYQQSGSIGANAHKDSDEQPWTRELIGDSVLVQFHDNSVLFFRGSTNTAPRKDNSDRSYEETDKRLQINARIKKELTEMSDILGRLSAATYEPGVEGSGTIS